MVLEGTEVMVSVLQQLEPFAWAAGPFYTHAPNLGGNDKARPTISTHVASDNWRPLKPIIEAAVGRIFLMHEDVDNRYTS
jgi:hypothetical protein